MFDWGEAAVIHPSTQVDGKLAELVAIAAKRRQLDAREAELLTDPDVVDECLDEHGHHLPHWLAEATTISTSAASTRVRTAQRLKSYFPQFNEALESGRVGWNHAALLTKVANPRIRRELAELIEPIIELAQVASFDRWCKEVRGIAAMLDDDGGYDPGADPANNWVKLTPTFDGSVDLSGRLVGELAFRISALVEAETDKVMARHRADAEQIAEADGHSNLPSRSQATAEALAEITERAAGTADGSGRLPIPEMVVVHDPASGSLARDNGTQLPQSMMRWLLAAALIRPLEVTGRGDPLRMGRTLRYANRDQRRAITIRDGGCIFPGCNRPPAWCDAHHVDHWDDGGPTDVENLALLCRHHHRVTHRPNWSMARSPDGTDSHFVWTTPSGRKIYSQHHRAHAPPLLS